MILKEVPVYLTDTVQPPEDFSTCKDPSLDLSINYL
jgi:hypothetical protein